MTDQARIWQIIAVRYCVRIAIHEHVGKYVMCPSFDWHICPCCSAAFPVIWPPWDRPWVSGNRLNGRPLSQVAFGDHLQNENVHVLEIGRVILVLDWLYCVARNLGMIDCYYPRMDSLTSAMTLVLLYDDHSHCHCPNVSLVILGY